MWLPLEVAERVARLVGVPHGMLMAQVSTMWRRATEWGPKRPPIVGACRLRVPLVGGSPVERYRRLLGNTCEAQRECFAHWWTLECAADVGDAWAAWRRLRFRVRRVDHLSAQRTAALLVEPCRAMASALRKIVASGADARVAERRATARALTRFELARLGRRLEYVAGNMERALA